MALIALEIRYLTPSLTVALLATACTLPPQRTHTYACPDGYEFTIRYSGSDDPGDIAVLEDASGVVKLPRAPAASGERYSNGSIVFWSKGDEATILRRDEVLHGSCSTDLDRKS